MQNASLIERAYACARSGQHRTVSDIAKALRKEGFLRGLIEDHLAGKSVKAELTKICRECAARMQTAALGETSAFGREAK